MPLPLFTSSLYACTVDAGQISFAGLTFIENLMIIKIKKIKTLRS
jgi:hypothetical protein